jgi:hypothetical protein
MRACSMRHNWDLDIGREADMGHNQGKFTVTLIEGDGIGPEIAQSVKDIYTAAKVGRHLILEIFGSYTDRVEGSNQVGVGRRNPAA